MVKKTCTNCGDGNAFSIHSNVGEGITFRCYECGNEWREEKEEVWPVMTPGDGGWPVNCRTEIPKEWDLDSNNLVK